jgi:tetratricopeptide (TPR) repeat protein
MIKTIISRLLIAASIVAIAHIGWARDRGMIAITIPLHGRLSVVQKLNRDGVDLVNKKQFDKAEALFLKAYLYDPADPFTLNNLGYIAELQGQIDRANKFYELASEQGCNAVIDRSSEKELKGKPMTAAIDGLQNSPMRVNHLNLEAIRLLTQNRGDAAIALLKQALVVDPQSPFTLNNLGVASEAVGNSQAALRYYEQVAGEHSSEIVVIAGNRAWNGKTVSDMAAASAKRLRNLLANRNPGYSEAALYSRRGVVAVNQNDWTAAREAFMQAYHADPSSAFSLNNRAYVAEMDGDLETAQFFYEKAAKANDVTGKVGLATQGTAEGKRLFSVVADSDGKVNGALETVSQQRHLVTAPVQLTPRGGVILDDTSPAQQKQSAPATPQNPN